MRLLNWLPAIALVLNTSNCAIAQISDPVVDGPYIFYKNDQGYAKSIELIDGNAKLKVDSFKVGDKVYNTEKLTR